MIAAEIIAEFLFLIFIGLNAMIYMARIMMRFGSAAWKKVFRIEIPENEKKSYEILQTVIWIAVGIWGFWKLKDVSMLGAFLGFFTFRSGSNVSKTLIYTIHDQKIVREYSSEGRLLSIIGTASTVSLLLETILITALTLAYKTTSATIKPGMSAGNFVLYLWATGFIFGIISGWLISRNNRGILLRNTFQIIVFFSARAGKKKVEKDAEESKSLVRKPLKKLRI